MKRVLVTGANGYIGGAVARAFSRAGWRTFGLVRQAEACDALARDEVVPLLGSPGDLRCFDASGGAVFDVVVSNTEDRHDAAGHFARVRRMVDDIALRSRQAGVRPLVMFSSGCKDYGPMSRTQGDASLAPHTEQSPLNPPAPLAARTRMGTDLLQPGNGLFDATVLRPTIVYGHASSHYGELFGLAARSDKVLRLLAAPNAIMHSLHVDDCAEGYVALAKHARRDEVAGQAFNLSNTRYETAREIGEALARSYGLVLECVAPVGGPTAEVHASVHSLANFWQWVSSDKLRLLTGWRERRPGFAAGIEIYRLAYEASRRPR